MKLHDYFFFLTDTSYPNNAKSPSSNSHVNATKNKIAAVVQKFPQLPTEAFQQIRKKSFKGSSKVESTQNEDFMRTPDAGMAG